MDGILLIDKPQDWTSHDVVAKVRNLINIKRIGHTGTLDPMATGLLVLCIGNATKFVKYLAEHDKEYDAEICLGIQTDSDDITGKIIMKQSIESIDETTLKTILQSFIGPSKQLPPVASAIKIDGKRAYEFVHRQQPLPEMTPREIIIHSIELIKAPESIDDTIRFSIRIRCSKGTYIRSLARDIGTALKVPATLSALRRLRVGLFSVDQSSLIEDIKQGNFRVVNPIYQLGFEVLSLSDEWLKLVKNGAMLPLRLFNSINETVVCNSENEPLAVYRFDSEKNMMRLSVLL